MCIDFSYVYFIVCASYVHSYVVFQLFLCFFWHAKSKVCMHGESHLGQQIQRGVYYANGRVRNVRRLVLTILNQIHIHVMLYATLIYKSQSCKFQFRTTIKNI